MIYVLKQMNMEEFSNFTNKISMNSFLQSAQMADVYRMAGLKYEILGLVDDQNEFLAAGLFVYRPIAKFFKMVNCSQGPVFKSNDPKIAEIYMDNICDYFKNKQVMHLQFTPNIINECSSPILEIFHQKAKHTGYYNNIVNGVARWFFVKNIENMTSQSLMDSFDQKTRYSIRRAMRLPISVEECLPDDLNEFKALMEHTANRREFSDRNLDYYKNLYHAFSKTGDIKILLARIDFDALKEQYSQEVVSFKNQLDDINHHLLTQKSRKYIRKAQSIQTEINRLESRLKELSEKTGKIPIAGSIFIQYNDETTYLFSGAYSEYLSYGAAYLLQWNALNWALESHSRRYNFYTTTGNFCDQEDDGIYQFKKGFGGELLEQPGNYLLIFKKIIYKIYTLYRRIK